jgi:hypothetical protein
MERDSTSRDSKQKSGEARGSGVGEETQLSAQFYSIILPIFFFFFVSYVLYNKKMFYVILNCNNDCNDDISIHFIIYNILVLVLVF